MRTLWEAKQNPSHVNSGSPSSADFGTTCFPACAEVITSTEVVEFPDIGEIIYTHTQPCHLQGDYWRRNSSCQGHNPLVKYKEGM